MKRMRKKKRTKKKTSRSEIPEVVAGPLALACVCGSWNNENTFMPTNYIMLQKITAVSSRFEVF